VTRLALLLALMIAAGAHAAEPDATAKKEISHLIDRLAASGCRFNRNGTWYEASRAVSHLKRKYEYLLDKGLVTDADAFIQHAASQSSASGKAYLVKCGDQPETPSAAWFRTALAEFRGKSSVPQAKDEAK
jgi:hypothetical protein